MAKVIVSPDGLALQLGVTPSPVPAPSTRFFDNTSPNVPTCELADPTVRGSFLATDLESTCTPTP